MLTRNAVYLFLFVVFCPPSLSQPLAQDAGTAPNPNNLVVPDNKNTGTNQVEQIAPNYSKGAEIIQQIDVKDDQNQAISNINHVAVSDVPVSNPNTNTTKNLNTNSSSLNNGTQGNVSPNVVLNNTVVPTEITNLTIGDNENRNAFNESSTLILNGTTLQSNSTGSTLTPDNATIPGVQNNLAKGVQTNFNTSNNTINNPAIIATEIIDGDNFIQANNTDDTIAWRSDMPVKGNNTGLTKNIVQLNSQNTSVKTNNLNLTISNETSDFSSTNNNDSVLLDSNSSNNLVNNSTLSNSDNDNDVPMSWRSDVPKKKNTSGSLVDTSLKDLSISDEDYKSKEDKENDIQSSIFMLLNSGNIDGFSVNSPDNIRNNEKLNSDVKINNNNIQNLNSSNSKLIDKLINSTINNVLSSLQPEQMSGLNSKKIFLLLNSGSISNINMNSDDIETRKGKDRLKKRSSDSKNIITSNAVTLKPTNDNAATNLDVEFRTGENNATDNIDQSKNMTAISNTTNSDNQYNTTQANFLVTTELNPIQEKIIPGSETPAFRSIPHKNAKTQVNNILTTTDEPNIIKDNSFVQLLLPESNPIAFDLNQLPVNNILGSAIDLIKRFKRNTKEESEANWRNNCDSYEVNDGYIVTDCEDSKPVINVLDANRKSFNIDLRNNEIVNKSIELVCPLSVFVKLITDQVLDELAKNESIIISKISPILTSILNNNEDAINLVSHDLSNNPFPVKLRLQLLHGDTEKFIKDMSKYMDTTVCLFT